MWDGANGCFNGSYFNNFLKNIALLNVGYNIIFVCKFVYFQRSCWNCNYFKFYKTFKALILVRLILLKIWCSFNSNFCFLCLWLIDWNAFKILNFKSEHENPLFNIENITKMKQRKGCYQTEFVPSCLQFGVEC